MAVRLLEIGRDQTLLRKSRGAFLTPPELCDCLIRWAVRSANDAVLEPSWSEAAFLVSAGVGYQGLNGGRPRQPGQLRGVGMRHELLAPHALMSHHADQTLEETRPWGLDGGTLGPPAAVVLNSGAAKKRRMCGKKFGYSLEQGDVWLLRASGGGGYGQPRKRDSQLLEGDIDDGYVTQDGAAGDYEFAGAASLAEDPVP
jgi:hypothetical protein